MRSKLLLCAALALLAAVAGAQEPAREEERVSLSAEDGWTLNARYLKAAEGAPTLVLIHAQKSDLTEWEPLFKPLKRYGFGYLALDLRGHGNSFVAPSGSTTTWRAFAIDGQDNEFNKMLRDVEAAISFLSTNSVTGAQTVLVGSILGANLAIKAAAIHPEISMVVAVSPVLNVNSVLSVNPLRAYGRRPILLIAGADRARQYAEFQILNHTAQIACGKQNVAVIVEAKGFGPGLVNKYNLRRVLDWVKNPRLPDIVEVSTAAPAGLTPDATGQAPADPEQEPAPMEGYSQD
ncbi:MAG: alpha/beta fold hydrolase [Elusimicrobia bacterium]|nr:alpha/beta fold hydrolase [Elusimicrobiota bacterium]